MDFVNKLSTTSHTSSKKIPKEKDFTYSNV